MSNANTQDVIAHVSILRDAASYHNDACLERAANALETLAGEVEYLEMELERVKKQREDYFSGYEGKLLEYFEMKILNAKLAPVVEAARAAVADHEAYATHGSLEMDALRQALATLEAAHD